MLAIISVTWRTPPLATSRCSSVSAPSRRFRQHRHADQPVRRRLAEFHQPVVVDAVARLAQHRVLGRDLEDRAEDDLRLDAVAVHVGEAQFGDCAGRRALWSWMPARSNAL